SPKAAIAVVFLEVLKVISLYILLNSLIFISKTVPCKR
ncbi:MAG: hypothetical protein ACI9ES_001053, partial [Oceanospirillaceae bacterium]